MPERAFFPRMVVVLLALTVLGFLFYSPVLKFPFVHDDVALVQMDRDIGRWDNIAGAFLRPVLPAGDSGIATPYYRPVLEVLTRAEYALFGMNPSGFHFFNILVHSVNGWLVWVVLTAGFACPVLLAFFLSCVFLLHPVQTQAVACVSGISNLAVTFFLLLSFLCYVKARRAEGKALWLWFGASAVAFVIALWTKENALVFPLILAAYDRLFPGTGLRDFRWRPVLVSAAIAFFYVLWRQALFPGLGAQWGSSLVELKLRLLSIPASLLTYAGLVVWPADLHYYRSVDILAPKLGPALGVFGWTLLGISGLLSLPADLRRQAAFGCGWFLLGLLPVLNILPLINEYSFVQAAEHFVYFPLIGVLLAGGAVLPLVTGRLSRRIVIMAASGLALACGMLTFQQVSCWRSETVVFERAARFEPRLGRVRSLLGRAYAQDRRFDEALAEYTAALQIMSEYVKKAGPSRADDVYSQFIKAIYADRGQVFMLKGDSARSNEDYLRSLAVRARSFDTFDAQAQDSRTANGLALNALGSGDMSVVERYFKLAVSLDSGNVEALNNLGMVFVIKKNDEMARFWFERALKVRPGFGPAWENLKRLDFKG